MSLVYLIDDQLESKVVGHGDAISYFLESKESKEALTDIADDNLEKLTEPGYLYHAMKELDTWRSIVANRFSMSIRRKWKK